MARTPSTMLELGTTAPDFSLKDTVSGRLVSRAEYAGRPLLVMFICNHCPFVQHVRGALAAIGRDYGDRVGIVAINPNDVANYPDDAPEKMRAEAETHGYVFPYVHDESQDVAKAYRASCTPDFFLFDTMHTLVYRGQLDDSRPGNDEPVTGKDLRGAIEAVVNDGAPSLRQLPSIGCNIKWIKGNEPEYYGAQ